MNLVYWIYSFSLSIPFDAALVFYVIRRCK